MAAKKEAISFETSISELEAILEKMSGEETSLEESIELYAKAAALVADCNKQLANASVKVEEISALLAKQAE